ncbi:threonine/serine dehydratase [Kaistia defluvii]|nr:threonine/serine dehydratase [Kaistia defluvii]
MTPTIDDIRMAAKRIAAEAVRTPLLSSTALDEITGGRVYLKCESLQRTGSFKFRGAYNAVASLSEAERAHGVVASSSGNHAQGIAEAARLFGVPATIVMPHDAPSSKRDGTRRRGASIVDYNRATDDRDALTASIVAETGAELIHPYNDGRVIAGQGTIGLEIVEDLARRGEQADIVMVPCGGGGMSAGISLAIAAESPGTQVYLAEPEGFDDYARSLASGSVQRNARTNGSICDALMARQPGAIGFAINRATGAHAVSISDAEALAAVAFAFRTLKLVVEPGGAAALAGLLSGRIDARGKTVAILLSGGNIDPDVLERALAA